MDSRGMMKIGYFYFEDKSKIPIWLTNSLNLYFRYSGEITELVDFLFNINVDSQYFTEPKGWKRDKTVGHTIMSNEIFELISLLSKHKNFKSIQNLDRKIEEFILEGIEVGNIDVTSKVLEKIKNYEEIYNKALIRSL